MIIKTWDYSGTGMYSLRLFFPPSVGIFSFIFNVISFWTVKHGKPGVILSLKVHVLVLQSLTYIGSLCCRSMGKEGRKKWDCKADFVMFFFPSLTHDTRNTSEEFLPLHRSTLLVRSCQQLSPALSYEWDQEISVTKHFWMEKERTVLERFVWFVLI